MSILTLLAALALSGAAHAAAATAATVPVTVDNFIRAETDVYLATPMKQAGGLAKFFHYREPMSIDQQTVVRANRDTLYSAATIDLDAGPATITLPDAGKRFRSMIVINQDHYIVGEIVYAAGRYTYDRQKVGTRYAMIALRTLVNPEDPKDVKQVHALQDASKITQGTIGSFDVPNWDPVSQKTVRDALKVLGSTTTDFKGAFGSKDQVDPVHHLIGTATGWGGNPDKDAFYLNVTPPQNDGKTPYRLVVKDVPVDGFWSLSLYNASGYFQKNDLNAYSVNNITAKKAADGSIVIQFGGERKSAANYLPIVPGWNYMVRLYRPRPEVLDKRWQFPQAQPMN